MAVLQRLRARRMYGQATAEADACPQNNSVGRAVIPLVARWLLFDPPPPSPWRVPPLQRLRALCSAVPDDHREPLSERERERETLSASAHSAISRADMCLLSASALGAAPLGRPPTPLWFSSFSALLPSRASALRETKKQIVSNKEPKIDRGKPQNQNKKSINR